jgi:hypothetical protein
MAEVRAIPSAVGAYEAQVLDFSGISNAYANILRQNELARKEAASLRKQLEDNLNTTINDKRVIRSQDDKYINGLKNDVRNYFSDNKSAIIKGGAEYNEFKKKMGLVTSEITRSLSIKENGVQLQNYAIKTMDPLKSTDVSQEFKNALSAYELPMNDERRKTFTFKNEQNQDVDVDQLTINELNRIAYFRPEQLQESIISNVPKEKIDFMFQSKGKDFTRSYSVRSPYGVATSVVNQFVQKPDAKSYYQKAAAEELAMNPDFQKNVDDAYQHMVKMYTNARATASGSGFGSVEYLFQEKDGQPGVDINNPYEFALFQSLYANLPQDLGITYDYRSQSNYRANQSLKLQKDNLYLQRLNSQQPKTIDGLVIEDIRNGKLDASKITSAINAFVSQKEAALGGLEPAKLSIDDNNKTMTAVTRRVLTDGTNKITDQAQADKYLIDNKLSGKVERMLDGSFYLEETRTISIDPNKNKNYGTEVSTLFDMIGDVQRNQTLYQGWQGLRQGRGKDVLKSFGY